MSNRRRHFSVERLSEEGQVVVRRGFDNNWTLDHTVGVLQTVTGEDLSVSSLHRWWKWQEVQRRLERRQQAVDSALAMVRSDPDGRMASAIRMMLQEQLLQREAELAKGDADELLTFYQQLERLGQAHKRLELQERAVGAEEKKADAALMQAEAALAVAEARLAEQRRRAEEAARQMKDAEDRARAEGRSLTPEEMRTIREQVFGLASPAGGDDAR